MFAVELTPPEHEAVQLAFGVQPALLYDPWKGYTGICVWEVNKNRTYSLPGEPTDERWGGVMELKPHERRWAIIDRIPIAERPAFRKRWQQSADYDSETQRGYADMLIAQNAPKPRRSFFRRLLSF